MSSLSSSTGATIASSTSLSGSWSRRMSISSETRIGGSSFGGGGAGQSSSSPSHDGARPSRYRLTSLQRSSTSQRLSSLPRYTSASETGIRATTDKLRSGASVTDAKESIADTSTGRSRPPTPASSVASTSRSGGCGNGGSVHVNSSGNWKSWGGSASGSSSLTTSSSKPRSARGSTSSERWRSIGPLHASSGWT